MRAYSGAQEPNRMDLDDPKSGQEGWNFRIAEISKVPKKGTDDPL